VQDSVGYDMRMLDDELMEGNEAVRPNDDDLNESVER
jgi:hypothetical protein